MRDYLLSFDPPEIGILITESSLSPDDYWDLKALWAGYWPQMIAVGDKEYPSLFYRDYNLRYMPLDSETSEN
jgi:hypothetical protein